MKLAHSHISSVYTNSTLEHFFKFGRKLLLIAILMIILWSVLSPFTLPFVITGILSSLFYASVIYVCGLGYGILNDMIACRTNIKYFIDGHNHGQRHGIINTKNPNVNAIAWGILATFVLSLVAAIIFGIVAAICFFAGAPFSPFLLGIFPICIPIAVIFIDVISKRKLAKENSAIKNNSPPDVIAKSKERNAWYNNSYRNSLGYIILPTVAVLSLIGIIIVSALHLPLIVLSAPLQSILFGIPAVLMIVALIYFKISEYEIANEIENKKNSLEREAQKPTTSAVISTSLSESIDEDKDNKPNDQQISENDWFDSSNTTGEKVQKNHR